MGHADGALKKFLSKKQRFSDLFNVHLWKGQQIILPEDLELINTESFLVLQDKKNENKDISRFRDIVMLWRDKVYLMVLACEIQDMVHYAMPVRNMIYDGLT